MAQGLLMTVVAIGCLLLGIVIGSRAQRGDTPLPVPKIGRVRHDDVAEEEMGWAMRDRRRMHFQEENLNEPSR